MRLRLAKKICKQSLVRSVSDMRRYDMMESVLPGWTQCFTGCSRRQIYNAVNRWQRWKK